jgi:hypothetical protein
LNHVKRQIIQLSYRKKDNFGIVNELITVILK